MLIQSLVLSVVDHQNRTSPYNLVYIIDQLRSRELSFFNKLELMTGTRNAAAVVVVIVVCSVIAVVVFAVIVEIEVEALNSKAPKPFRQIEVIQRKVSCPPPPNVSTQAKEQIAFEQTEETQEGVSNTIKAQNWSDQKVRKRSGKTNVAARPLNYKEGFYLVWDYRGARSNQTWTKRAHLAYTERFLDDSSFIMGLQWRPRLEAGHTGSTPKATWKKTFQIGTRKLWRHQNGLGYWEWNSWQFSALSSWKHLVRNCYKLGVFIKVKLLWVE